jgi:hypothetical protein
MTEFQKHVAFWGAYTAWLMLAYCAWTLRKISIALSKQEVVA